MGLINVCPLRTRQGVLGSDRILVLSSHPLRDARPVTVFKWSNNSSLLVMHADMILLRL